MVEIGYLIDDDIHDIFITNVQSIKNESLIEAKRKADLYKENEFIELTDIFSTEFRKFSPHVNFALILISTLLLTLTLMLSLSCLRLFSKWKLQSLLVHSNGHLNFNSSETIYRMIRNMLEIERNISDSNWHMERNFMIKRRKKPQNLLKLDVSFLVLSITCFVGTFLFYIMRLMEEHEEKVSQMFNQKRVFDKGWDFVTIFIRIPTLLDHVKANGRF